jgi:hypothetical protein
MQGEVRCFRYLRADFLGASLIHPCEAFRPRVRARSRDGLRMDFLNGREADWFFPPFLTNSLYDLHSDGLDGRQKGPLMDGYS